MDNYGVQKSGKKVKLRIFRGDVNRLFFVLEQDFLNYYITNKHKYLITGFFPQYLLEKSNIFIKHSNKIVV